MTAVLQAQDIVAGYGDAEILRGVTLHVDANELVCVLGPNGAGKSTLLKVVVGLLRPRSGDVRLGDQSLVGLTADKVVARGLAYVPQVANVFPSLTVSENLDMGAFLQDDGIEDARERVLALFPALGERLRERVARLSGGQRQMVAIARALMPRPRVLLLDEPTAGLAPQLQDQVLDAARAIAHAGTPTLLVEQNAKKALARTDRAYVLDQGRNRYEGRGADLLADERLGRLYLGQPGPTP